MPNEEWEEFNKDPRTKCKYAEKCYQRNAEHHKTYKHPPHTSKAVKNTREKRKFSPFTRKFKDLDTNTDSEKDSIETKEKESVCEHETSKLDLEDTPTSSDITNNLQTKTTVENYKIDFPKEIKFYDEPVDHEIFKQLFLVEMPPDFYKFYESLNKEKNIEKLLASVNLQLIGPFDLLLGKLPILDEKDMYLIHWRFFYDPPEFQAILKRTGSSQYHMGYYRDDPDGPVFVASNDSEKDCRISPMAENLFGAVYIYLENEKKKSPFSAMACQRVMEKIKKSAAEQNISLVEYSMKKRQGKIVTKTLHGAGIVVPYNKKSQLGYRLLVETDENLKKIFARLQNATTQADKEKALSELQPVITYASIAVDECDFGTGLEAGIDLFCSGLKELHPSAISMLSSVYPLLKREAFGKIIMAHLKYRRKGSNLSILDFK